MEHSTIALIILLITTILYALEKPPIAVTSILAAIAMAFTGCIGMEDALKGFANTATLMIIGLCIVGESFFTTGLTNKVGEFFMKKTNMSEKTFIILFFIIGALTSALLNGLIVIAIFMPLIDSLAASTDGRISRKNCYLPLGISALFGGNLSAIGSTSMINASAQLGNSYFGRPLMLFEPFLIGLPGVLISLILLAVTGTELQKLFFDFKESVSVGYNSDTANTAAKTTNMTPRMWIVLLTLVGCIIAFIFGMDYGLISMLAACLLICFHCIDLDRAMSCVSWSTVLVVVGTLGISGGIGASGAGQLIADTFLKVCGPISNSPFAICVVFLFLATILSNFMSNNATVGILLPVALATAQVLQADPVAYTLAIGVGANISCMTPICTSTITMTAICGYRFKDYIRYGGIFNILAFIGTAAMLKIVYF